MSLEQVLDQTDLSKYRAVTSFYDAYKTIARGYLKLQPMQAS